MGRVKVLLTPDHPLLEGCVAVTFEDVTAARICVDKLNGRWFDGRQLTVELILSEKDPSMQRGNSDRIVESNTDVDEQAQLNVTEEECHDVAAVEEAAQDVEDFLNSLL